MQIAVIGAGPAGLTAAYQISKQVGKSVDKLDVFEVASDVGGMSRSLTLWNQTVDLGPHRFFSKDKKINSLWLEVVGNEYEIVQRTTRIFYKKKYFDYPIRAFNALKGLGIIEAVLCVLSYMKQKVAPEKDISTFEGWVTSRFGKRLYSIFFKTYSEKLWGIKCTELDSDFASQRIKKLSLFEAIKNALQSKKQVEHATLVEQFAYPVGGTGKVYRKMQEKITQNGGAIHLGKGVKRVITENSRAVALEFENGEVKRYDHIISTMPLSLLVNRMANVPSAVIDNANALRFRNTILVYIRLNNIELFKDQWLYIHDSEVRTGRITNFRNWIPQLYGDEQSSILCLEYWCNFEDELWKAPDETLVETASSELVKLGIADKEEILNGEIYRIPRCYPVYYSNYRKDLEPIQQFLTGISSLHIIGRYGAYKYNNQDHSILMGMMAAENILENQNHDLWEVNTDYEVYQESAVITKTGLANDPNK